MKELNETKPLVTVVTTTFNREKTLPILYKSLCKQNDMDFLWLIIDDGSTDGTQQLVETWRHEECRFGIYYIYKENGGRHTALNVAFRHITTTYAFIVDSDDCLTTDAIHMIRMYSHVIEKHNLAGVSFLRGYNTRKAIGDRFSKRVQIDNEIRLNYQKGIKGDKAEVWRSDILKRYCYPEYPGEKYIGESFIWNQISMDYNKLFVNKIVYICRYLPDGLTRQGRKIRLDSPRGMMDHSLILIGKFFPFRARVKGALLYNVYALSARDKGYDIRRIKKKSLMIILFYIPGCIVYRYWKRALIDRL